MAHDPRLPSPEGAKPAAPHADWGLFYSFVYQDGRLAYGVNHVHILAQARMDRARPYIVGGVGETQGELYAEFYGGTPDRVTVEQLEAEALEHLRASLGHVQTARRASACPHCLAPPCH